MSTASSSSHARIFVSHAHADNALCDRYVAALRACGLDVWYDRTNLQVGESLSETIETQLRQRTALVVIYTPASVASRWVRREVDAFQALADQDPSRLVIPVRATDCEVPLLMRGSLYADAVQDGFDATIDNLAKALGVPKQAPRPKPLKVLSLLNPESRGQAEMQAGRPIDDTAGASAGPPLTPAPAPHTTPAGPVPALTARRRVFVPEPAPQQFTELSSPSRTATTSATPVPAQPARPAGGKDPLRQRIIVLVAVLLVLSSTGILLLYWQLYLSPSWGISNSPPNTPLLSSIAMISATEGWAVGGIGGTGVILHYSSGQWTTVSNSITGFLSSVVMISATEGWAVGDTILHYSGGQWESANSSTTDHLFSISMISTSEGWAVGADNTGTHGVILHYSDGQWSTATSPSTDGLTSISMVSATEGWAVGDGGTILHYSGGQWSTATNPPNTPLLSSVVMISATEGWAVGERGAILHYSGGHWTLVDSHIADYLDSVAMISASEGWAVGGSEQSGVILHYSAIL